MASPYASSSTHADVQLTLVSNLYPPDVIGGAERHVRSVAERLADRGFDVSVITTHGEAPHGRHRFQKEHRNGVEVYRFTPANLYTPAKHQQQSPLRKPLYHLIDLWNPHVYMMISGLLDSLRPELVHIHNFGGLSNAVFRAASRVAPVLHTLHDYSLIHVHASLFIDGEIVEPGFLSRPYQYFNRRTIEPHLDRVLAPSQFIIDKHRDEGLLESIPCTCLPLGVETESRPAPSDPPVDEFRCLYVGQLTVQKGVDILIDAFMRLDAADVRLDILGKGPERASLERQAAEDDRIFFHGFVPEEELERQLTQAHLTIVPSRWYDNSPMVIYESYAHGTPVLGAAIGGIPELIDSHSTGFLFEAKNCASLARQIEMAREQLDHRMIKAAHQYGAELTLSAHLDELIEIYTDALQW